jgi:hypothetical protein
MGYWGPITSNYDWCEENYVWTQYIAEFFNTLSSIPVALAGVSFLRLTREHGYGKDESSRIFQIEAHCFLTTSADDDTL